MVKNLIRVLSALIGAVLGYGVFGFVIYVLMRFGVVIPKVIMENQFKAGVATAIIFGFLFFIIAPALTGQGVRLAKNIGSDLQNVSAGTTPHRDTSGAAFPHHPE